MKKRYNSSLHGFQFMHVHLQAVQGCTTHWTIRFSLKNVGKHSFVLFKFTFTLSNLASMYTKDFYKITHHSPTVPNRFPTKNPTLPFNFHLRHKMPKIAYATFLKLMHNLTTLINLASHASKS
jgi:hypothetical protein